MDKITDDEIRQEFVALWKVIHAIVNKLGIEIDFNKRVDEN